MNEPTPLPLPQWTPAKWDEHVYPAGDWVLQDADQSRMLMGRDDQIIWAKSESLFVVGDTGYGKSTYMQNIAMTAIGLKSDMLGFKVQRFQRILYIAADRPSQIKYSLARMVDDNNRQIWNEHVFVHEGPLDFAINERPELLLAYAQHPRDKWDGQGCDLLIVDSLKDVANAISDDEEGMKVNAALQSVNRAGIELMVSHHPRKGATIQRNGKPLPPSRPSLDDVFGSKFLTAGAGSVIFIHDKDGDNVQATQVKSPAGEVYLPAMRFDPTTGGAKWAI